MKKWCFLLLWANIVTSVAATNYYVSPEGNDSNSGVDSVNAWLSFDNGDQNDILNPGDTVFIYPGTYAPTRSMQLTSSGTSLNHIVYKSISREDIILNSENNSSTVLIIDSDYIKISGLTIQNTSEQGIISNGSHVEINDISIQEPGKEAVKIYGDSSIISNCTIFDANNIGLRIYGSYNTIYRNVINSCKDEGIKNEDEGEFANLIYNNTILNNGSHGIELKAKIKSNRVFNNIIISNGGKGIIGPVESICGFNNVWGNSGGNYDGVVDSAGGLSGQPLFFDEANFRFELLEGCLTIDAGLDLGYAYNSLAPDLGAFEKYNVFYVSTTGSNLSDGTSIDNAWQSVCNGNGYLAPGDTIRILPGTYTEQCFLTDNGAAINDLITYKGVRDSVFIDGQNTIDSLIVLFGDYVEWTGISVKNSIGDNIYAVGNYNIVSYCQIDNATDDGIHADDIFIAHNNVIVDNGQNGIHLGFTDSSLIYNNTFYNNNVGLYCNNDDNEIYNNIFSDNTVKGIQARATSQVSYCIFYNNNTNVSGGVAIGFGSIITNPKFLDTLTHQFRLKSNSPAIDAGYDDGQSYVGLAPDIGAYEANAPVTFTIEPFYDSLIADSLYPFEVFAIDSNGYPAYQGDLTWEHTFSTGFIDTNGVFNPQIIGTGEIIVTSSENGISDTTLSMNVVPGSVEDIAISPNSATITTDSTIQFTVSGTDIDGNITTNKGVITWGLSKNIGSIDSNGLLTPSKAGKTLVTAISDLGPSAVTDTIRINTGAISFIKVTPEISAIIEDSSVQFTAEGYDADSNFIKGLTDSVTWSTDDPGGNVTSEGLYTAGSNPSPPNYYVKADYNSFSDSGTVVIVSNGLLSYIQIESSNGSPITDLTTSTDNDTTEFFCRGYASDSSLIGDLSVQWVLLGNDSIGYFSDTIGTSNSLTLNKPGTGQIEAIFSLAIKDTSGTITCQTGNAAEFLIDPNSYTVSTDSILDFSAIAYDADNNAVVPAIIPSWDVIGDIGTIDFSGQFSPTTVGVGRIVASGSGIADTSEVITVTVGELNYITIEPDSIIISADSQKQFTATGYDAHGNETSEGIISWSLLDPLGSFNGTGLLDPTVAGETQVIAISNLGFTDTSSFLQIIPGKAVELQISPDSVEITTDSTLLFTVEAFDTDGNNTSTGTIDWGVIGSIGYISPTGYFTAINSGIGQIYAENSFGIADTNKAVVITSGNLDRLVIMYDTSIINLYDSLQFTAIGYDADFNPTDYGTITWGVTNSNGSISSSGMFNSTVAGNEFVTAKSSIGNIADTTTTITIEALSASVIGTESKQVFPNTKGSSGLIFHLENQYIRDKIISGITINDSSRGKGSQTELLTNIDSIGLYLDIDSDLLITGADQLLDKQAYNAGTIDFSFSPVTISGGMNLTFLTNVDYNLFAADNDSVNYFIVSETDFEIQDVTPVIGLDTIANNSYQIINGLVSAQINLTSVTEDTLTSVDTIVHLLTCDVPRNGYQSDTLKIINITNEGTATEVDIDSLILYLDNGNNSWEGMQTETKIGKLSFTGDRWTRSGLAIPLTSQTTRFYLVGYMNKYPTNGATVSLTIPQYGLEMSSANDGPIDQNVIPIDTLPILTDEKVTIEVLPITSRELIPGQESGPVLNLLLSNLYSMNIGVDSIQFDYIGEDPNGASQVLQSSQFTSIKLYHQKDRNTDGISAEDTLISEGILINGQIVFSTAGLTLMKNGGNTILTIVADLDLTNSKNGNSVGFQLSDSSLIYVDQPAVFNASFPLYNPGIFTINAFPSEAVTLNAVPGITIFGGQNRELVLDFELPANGYEDDSLKSIRIKNIGSQSDSEAVAALDLWYDIDNNGFTPTDIKLGSFSYITSYWEFNHIDQFIPVGGKRFFITTDIFNTNFSGGTLQFEIMQNGCTYSSGMIGPDDAPIENPNEHVVFPSNRITAISLPGSEEIITPGGADKTILSFALYNGYTDRDQVLNSVGFTNISHSLSTPDYSDYELGSISLFYDADNSGTLNESTPVATGRFINNKLNLSGLNITLPKEELSYFFVVSDFPNSLIDSDSLAISIAAPSDFSFVENVNINGALPLTRGSYLIVDGSSKSQYTIYPVSPKTLSPGDTSVPLFAFSPALNGDLGDRLDSLRIENSGSADNSDIMVLNVWLDKNNDAQWQDSDSLLMPFTYNAGGWEINDLGLDYDTVAPVLFITGDISVTATPDRTFKTFLPVNGCQYASDNDGPKDLPLSDANTFTISGSNLRVEFSQMKPTYSVGESVKIGLKATNLSASTLDNIVCNVVLISDSQAVSLDSSVSGPISLGAGESSDFAYYYTANSATSLNWQMQVVAKDINDSSSVIVSPTIQIQNSPIDIPIVLINSMPTAVTKGQSNVFPLSLTISHPDSLPTSAPIRLDSLFLTIETAAGQPQLATSLFSRIILTAGFEMLSAIETIPNVSTVPMYFINPLIINVNEQKSLTLLVNIDSAATATDMVLSINTSAHIPLEDYNNSQSLIIDPSVVFPLKTASCRIDMPSNKMEISVKPSIQPNANYGQNNFNLIGFEISHPGGQSSSQIQLTSLSFELLNQLNEQIPISDVFNRIKVRKQFSIVADLFDNLDSSAINIQLTSPITLNPGEKDSLYIMADINDVSTVSGFKLQIADSTAFVVRDLSSGSLITVTADTNSLITSNLFPIVTSTANLKMNAQSPEICFQSVLSPSIISGKDSLNLIVLSIDYPYSTAYSPVVLQSMLIYFLDSLERPLDPISLFDRLGYKMNNAPQLNYQPFIQLSSGAVLFNFTSDSIVINPGDSLNITIVGDIEADVPYDHFRLMINEPQSINLYDQTDTAFTPLVTFDANCTQSYPLLTSFASIISPAGRPGVNTVTSEVMTVHAGQQNVTLFSTDLHYDQQSHQGDLLFTSLLGYLQKRTQSGYTSYSASQIFDNVSLMIDGIPYSSDSVLSNEVLSLLIDSGVVIKNGESAEISLVADIKPDAQTGNYRFEFSDSTFLDIEDLQLATNVYPILLSGSYPILSKEISLASVNLKESFSNYPNPFMDATTITFVMAQDGRVDIELFTITGKSVLTLVDNEYRTAGVYNSDIWYGKNAEGLEVVAGTYFCKITVKYDSQEEESELRKISVIR